MLTYRCVGVSGTDKWRSGKFDVRALPEGNAVVQGRAEGLVPVERKNIIIDLKKSLYYK